MALLSGLIREVAITGRTETLNTWWAGRQGGRWAEQTVRLHGGADTRVASQTVVHTG